jgi:hypothetical protein
MWPHTWRRITRIRVLVIALAVVAAGTALLLPLMGTGALALFYAYMVFAVWCADMWESIGAGVGSSVLAGLLLLNGSQGIVGLDLVETFFVATSLALVGLVTRLRRALMRAEARAAAAEARAAAVVQAHDGSAVGGPDGDDLGALRTQPTISLRGRAPTTGRSSR